MARIVTRRIITNAPAGSGKSTEIKKSVNEWVTTHPQDRLLCVTFTNRAVEEIKSGVDSSRVIVSTIHSYFNSLARSLFKNPKIVALFCATYEDEIRARIANSSNNERTEESNDRYRAQLGSDLSPELIRESIEELYYSDSNFDSYLSGGLSHDSLLSFVSRCGEVYPALYRRVSSRFSRIIIDEYQDTSADVLSFFSAAVEGTSCELLLYGDRMQQIYPSKLDKFRNVLSSFDNDKREVINYRSTRNIVSTLNGIYNNADLTQKADTSELGSKPRVLLTSEPDQAQTQLASGAPLFLTVHNSSIFSAIEATTLLKTTQAIPEYSFGSRTSATSVLFEQDWQVVSDPLIRLLYGLLAIEAMLAAREYGLVVQTLRRNADTFGRFSLNSHAEKATLLDGLVRFFQVTTGPDSTIADALQFLADLADLLPTKADSHLNDENYARLIQVPFSQVRATYDFNQGPTHSTQHGVKGEGHNAVVFIAKNSSTPRVAMDLLFEIWPKCDLRLESLESFYVAFGDELTTSQEQIGLTVAEIDKASLDSRKADIVQEVTRIDAAWRHDEYYAAAFAPRAQKFLTRPGVASAKSFFKITDIEGLLAAYRLFYVGCSRARRELDVIIDASKVSDPGALSETLERMGFEVTDAH